MTAKFLSTLSLRRATHAPTKLFCELVDFYPRSPCGERHHMPRVHVQLSIFLSTLSLRRATDHVQPGINPTHISIHALLAESDMGERSQLFQTGIFLSTLSLRRATGRGYQQSNHRSISIHALLAESDEGRVSAVEGFLKFLSTLSLRRAT